MKIRQPENRLQQLWGRIDLQHNQQIAHWITPSSRILDIGCGYGSLVQYLQTQGHRAMGIDIDPEALGIARRLYPHLEVQQATVENLAQTETSLFDAVTMKDALHHVIGEGNPDTAFEAIRKLLKPNGQLIILDPNLNMIVRTARRLIGHIDEEAPLEQARQLLLQKGFTIEHITFYGVIGLPLSGGYVGYQLVPNIPLLHQFVATSNHLLSKTVWNTPLAASICWRYIISSRIKA